ncbi:hypothetical protein HCN44_005901 [Aphidius gifuensis]|uniref:Uncharacterized protein n=1 Tax=Aphidius gifuensis TaxID=684658 RepID=A0A834XTD0_APHGI|nr:hypothetical protein HCN44_005901 [Aphidius gifuensis]
MILINRTGQLFSPEKSCVRYCIENSKKQSTSNEPTIEDNYINIIWQVGQKHSTNLTTKAKIEPANEQPRELGTKTSDEIEVSLMRNDEDNFVEIQTINSPSGDWLLKLQGSSDNEMYNLSIIQINEEFENTLIYQKTQLNDKQNSYEKDPNNRGVVIYFEDNEPIKSRNAALKYPDDNMNNEMKMQNNSDKIIFKDSREELSMLSADNEIQQNDDLELDDLSRATSLNTKTTRQLIIDIDPATSLIAKPNTVHRVIFTVTNNYFSKYQIINGRWANQLFPYEQWIRAGETITINIFIEIPNFVVNTVNMVSLLVKRQSVDPYQQKSAYIYVESFTNQITDATSPTIDYTFYDNCWGKRSKEYCSYSRWSVEMTVTDSESGLKKVSTQPGGVRPKYDYIAGTKNPVKFIYTSTCCYSTVKITAIDVLGNENSRTLDVTDWWNLSAGEITAIVLGFIIIIILIIICVLICVYWYRRRKSADLTYTQRYGSRTTPTNRGTERTSF